MFQCNLQMTLIHWLWNIPKACQSSVAMTTVPLIFYWLKVKMWDQASSLWFTFCWYDIKCSLLQGFLFYFPWIKLRNYHTHKYACVLVFPLDIVIFNFQCKDGGGVIERKNLRKQVKYSTSYILPKGNKTRLANF